MPRALHPHLMFGAALLLFLTASFVEEVRTTMCGTDIVHWDHFSPFHFAIQVGIPAAVLLVFSLLVAISQFAFSKPNPHWSIAVAFSVMSVVLGALLLVGSATESLESICTTAHWGGVSSEEIMLFGTVFLFLLWFAVSLVFAAFDAIVAGKKNDI